MINPPKKSKGVMIVSGGMDSVTLMHYLVKELECDVSVLSFDYGQKHVKELEAAEENCKELGIDWKLVSLSCLSELLKSNLLEDGGDIPEGHYEAENMKQTVVPNRNMIMSSIAVGYGCSIGADWLSLGVHSGDHAIYPDCREEFIDAFRKAVELSDWKDFTVFAPFQDFTKKDILEVGIRNKVNYAKTWTCYKGRVKACGKCGSCQERLEAFKILGKTDPIKYEN